MVQRATLLPVGFHCVPGPASFNPSRCSRRDRHPSPFSVQFSRLVVSDSLRPHGLQHAITNSRNVLNLQKRNQRLPLSHLQVLWLPNRQRPFVRKVAPGFQQMSGSKEAAASLRRSHIQRLNLRYTQVSRQELRCLSHPPRLTQRTGHAGSRLREERWRPLGRPGLVCELGPLAAEVPSISCEHGMRV